MTVMTQTRQGAPTVTAEGLRFTYRGARRPSVDGMTFGIEPGEVFGLLGPSGAGKSTTQKLLIGLLRGYEGRVAVLGRDLAHWGPDYYERVGVCFELPTHFQKLTALENLRFFASLYAAPTVDPRALLEALGLAESAGMPVAQWSKGMQVRLNLARALLHQPELLFLDEPTAGLDPSNARRVKELVHGLRDEGRTVFLTTHDMAVADELCDRVAFVVDGRIAVTDTPRALKLRYGERRVRVEHRQGHRLEVATFPLDELDANAEFLALLRSGVIETIHTREASLEDVFVRVTGRGLR